MGHARRKGLLYSATLHLALLLLSVFGLPAFLADRTPPPPMVIAIDVLPISEITNVKPSELPLAEKQTPEPAVQEPVPPTPPPAPKDPPPPPKEEIKEPPPKPDSTVPAKKPPPPKPKKKTDPQDLEAILKSLKREQTKREQAAAKDPNKPPKDAGTLVKGKDSPYDPNLPLSMSEMDAIRSQMAKCWNVPAGAKDAHALQVTLRVQLDPEGQVLSVALAEESKTRYSSDSFFRAAADSAIRAVRQCSPLRGLSAEKYATWKDMVMTFDPKEMLF